MVDVTPEKGAGVEHWAKVFNLKQSAKSLSELEKYGFKSLEDLQTALKMAKTEEGECRESLKAVEMELRDKKELQKRMLAYANTKPIRDEYRVLKSDMAKAKFQNSTKASLSLWSRRRNISKSRVLPKYQATKLCKPKLNG